MNSLIGISTQCLYYWVPRKDWATEQLKIITILRKYVSRIELYFELEDIITCNDSLLETYIKETAGLTCSLHLPSLSTNTEGLENIFLKIEEIMEKLHIEYAVWHSDDFAKTELLIGKVFPPFIFGLENSDIRKFGFQHLRDIAILGPYPIILDIDHIDEFKKNSFENEIQELKNPVLGIHFSTPINKYFEQFKDISTTHFPFSRSENTPPKDIPRNIPIIIEGVFPPSDFSLIEDEIALIEKTYFN